MLMCVYSIIVIALLHPPVTFNYSRERRVFVLLACVQLTEISHPSPRMCWSVCRMATRMMLRRCFWLEIPFRCFKWSHKHWMRSRHRDPNSPAETWCVYTNLSQQKTCRIVLPQVRTQYRKMALKVHPVPCWHRFWRWGIDEFICVYLCLLNAQYP